MEVERVNIAAAARSGSGDANQLPPLPPAGCAPPPGVSAAPRAVPRRKGSITHTYQLPLVFEALIHAADDLHHHLLHCKLCSVWLRGPRSGGPPDSLPPSPPSTILPHLR